MDNVTTQVVVAIIGATPVLLAPLVTSLLQRQGYAQKAKEVEMIEKRVQIIERLLALDEHLSDERKNLLKVELADIAQDLVAERSRVSVAGSMAVERLSFLSRTLLVYEQPTLRASVYRGFFWFFLSVGLLVALVAPFADMQSENTDMNWPFAVFGALFYVVIGLLFRSAALRQHKRVKAGAAERH